MQELNYSLEQRFQALRKSTLFQSLPVELLTPLAAAASVWLFRDGEHLVSVSHRPSLFVILEGKVAVERELGESNVPLGNRHAGQTIGELSIFDGEPPSANVLARDEVVAMRIKSEAFRDCLAKSPGLCMALLAEMARRLREADRSRMLLQSGDVMSRLASELLARVKENRICLEVSQTELGRCIGATRESVNKSLKGLQSGSRPALFPEEEKGCFTVDVEQLQRLATR
jgi:CRP/FNR family transcriptional regulator, cyclic AMP receptor protein